MNSPPPSRDHHDSTSAYAHLRGDSMGTTWTVCYAVRREALAHSGVAAAASAAGGDLSQRLAGAIQEVLDRVVDQMSTWEPDSVISALNRASPGWYQVPAEFFHVLRHALAIAGQSEGAYDPTVGRLTDLWGFGPGGSIQELPAQADIDAALSQSGWRRTAINPEMRGIWQPGGLSFDLSSIAKGYGVDEIARVLDEHGIDHYLAELGGELKARGLNPQGAQWALDIEAPDRSPPGFPITLADCAIATSGDYRRCFHRDGRRYAHTLDPRTGRPLHHTLESVSVLHAQCMMADGLATALLCQGLEKGLAYARLHKIAALFISRQGEELAVDWTDGFQVLAAR